MKKADKQILSVMNANEEEDVFKAIDLYQKGIKDKFKETEKELREEGWRPHEEKPPPELGEFYFFNDKYWLQTYDARAADIKKALGNNAKIPPVPSRNKKNKTSASDKNTKGANYTGQKMDLETSPLACPKCGNKLYKQSVCGGCADGKKGFKIRLICEDNPDHEMLL